MKYHPEIQKAFRKFRSVDANATKRFARLTLKHRAQEEKLRTKQLAETVALSNSVKQLRLDALSNLNQVAERHGTTGAAVLVTLNK